MPPQTIAYIRNSQEASGGWNFAGDRTGDFADVDTTGLAIQALVAARVKKTDPDLRQGLAYLGRQNQANGAWQSFGADDPNSTAVAMLAITAAGFDPTTRCWRDAVSPTRKGNPWASPVELAAEPPAGERSGPEPERRVRDQHVPDDPDDPGAAPGLAPGEAARQAEVRLAR